MVELLVFSNVVLWLLVIALGVLIYALTRQVGALYERVAPAGALMVNDRLRAGEPAPAMDVPTLTGDTLAVGRAQLLFFLAPDCPVCKSLVPVLRSLRQDRDIQADIVLASDGGTTAEHIAYVRANRLDDFPYVVSEALGRAYGVGKLPYAVLVDSNGTVSAMGIVNSREHLESLFVAQEMNVASIQAYMAGDDNDLYEDATAEKRS